MKQKVNPFIFRAYDIRGIAMAKQLTLEDSGKDIDPNEQIDLTEESIYLIGRGTGTYLRRNYGKNVVVGHDNRLTAISLQKAFIRGLLDTGCHVSDVGLCTSPMMYWATCALPFDAGVNITASHNPKEYNGVKIVTKGAHSICGDELQDVLKLIQAEDFDEGKGTLSFFGECQNMSVDEELPVDKLSGHMFQMYMKDLLSKVSLKRKLKIVIDAGNATTGKFVGPLFRGFGCEVVELFCDLDGTYPHHEANPEEAANMRDLSAKVLEVDADLGIGFDGDGDRVGIVDEKGKHYSADYVLLLLARDMLSRNEGGKVVFDVKVSRVLIDDIEKHGGVAVMSKTGHSFIESKMKEIHALLGGEVSGHMFFAENYYGFDDAFLAALKLLEILSETPGDFSALFKGLPEMYATPEYKVKCTDEKKFQIVKEVTEHFVKLYDCVTIDGVRVNFDSLSWAAIRASNTSPNLTMRFESSSEEKLKNMQKVMAEVLQKYPEVDMSWYI